VQGAQDRDGAAARGNSAPQGARAERCGRKGHHEERTARERCGGTAMAR